MTTASEQSTLYLARLEIDPRRLYAASRRQRVHGDADDGYLVHCLLARTFGDDAPAPFAITALRDRLAVLAYCGLGADALRERACAFADPADHAAIDWEGLAAKQMPATWPAGRRLGFEARVCPVVRKAREGERHRRGAEVDAFLDRCWACGPEAQVEREAVYREWLARELAWDRSAPGGDPGSPAGPVAARLESATLHRFQLSDLLRRTQGNDRRARRCRRPDATLRGTLEVVDGGAFSRLLARGVGRHRAFGFGMLLLRAAEAAAC